MHLLSELRCRHGWDLPELRRRAGRAAETKVAEGTPVCERSFWVVEQKIPQ
jgi:hypothetical protein